MPGIRTPDELETWQEVVKTESLVEVGSASESEEARSEEESLKSNWRRRKNDSVLS